MLGWLRRSMGDSAHGSAAVLGVLDDIWHPGAARAREQLDAQNELVMPTPSPGDKLLEDGKIVVVRRCDQTARGSGEQGAAEFPDRSP
jgi:hypothetical protein